MINCFLLITVIPPKPQINQYKYVRIRFRLREDKRFLGSLAIVDTALSDSESELITLLAVRPLVSQKWTVR